MTILLLVIGGAIGAPARYVTDLMVQSRHDTVFPWGTLAVNTVGSFVIGGMGAAASMGDAPSWLVTLVGTGFCGALTTFSSFGLETMRLIEDGSILEALAHVTASLVLGLLAVVAGWALVGALV